ncbi:sensory transduction histidine kinase [Thermogutta terrifontis]|uniref:Sensory transduction histidine kinase n=1 Tax=Thermogutta terrifontis TaxID=1331910 RepID=A0A286REX0_9BACT|nr:GAF domain-containing protein [Thermogutta terrifontis]ASV74508.1 sensory transduction histidine kinase [Thermogutta terrifontis]
MNEQNETVKPVTPAPPLGFAVIEDSARMGAANKSLDTQPCADASAASLVETLTRINECFLRLSSDDVYSEVLDEILKALKSEYGIIGYIDRSGRLVCPSLTRHVWNRCQMADKKIVFELDELGGVLAQVLKQQLTVCVNQPVATPPGHVPITRFLGVPLIVQDRLVAAIFLANKSSDYTQEDVRTLEMIARFLAPIVDAHIREEQEKEKRVEYEKRLAIQTQQLKRRNRQLECLAGLSDLAERGASIEEMVELTSHLLAGIFQDLPNVYSRIIFGGRFTKLTRTKKQSTN